MEKYSLEQTDDIKFIDEFPLVTEALRLHNSEAKETDELIEYLKTAFE